MITIKTIKPEEVQIWKDGEFLRFVNEYEFNDLRVQIQKEQAEGYSVWFAESESIDGFYPINKHGNIENWPKGLFDVNIDLLGALIRGQIQSRTNKQ